MSAFCGKLKPQTDEIGNKTQKQNRAIWALAHKLGFSNDDVHELALEVTGKQSIRALSRKEADDVIDRMGGQPFFRDKSGTPRRTVSYRRQQTGVVQLETEKQLNLLRDLATRRGWSEETLQNFCQRQIKKSLPTTTKEANKVIEGIKAMNKRDYLKREKSEPPASAGGTQEAA